MLPMFLLPFTRPKRTTDGKKKEKIKEKLKRKKQKMESGKKSE